jgi:Zn-dependent M16 (insulinase) family peptidase
MKTHERFELIREQTIPELNAKARIFRHVKTGAELLSLENDDENKVFGITFRTPPPDSTGLPHILEHSVLCGSRKYPVKEPFVELVKGSLKTFLNAFTFPDKTCYPVASQNVKDFYNLIDVYLDAVFYPRITAHIFEQEGWHYELENPDDPIAFKGVVFNEMKGAYSSPDDLLSRHSQRSIFPDTPYSRDSGGDPSEIPNLRYDQFKAFHRTYYHPSNARIFFYGDDDPEERLRFLETYLGDFEPTTVESDVSLQSRFEQPQRFTIPYDAGEESSAAKKGLLTLNWLLTETTDPQMTLGLSILNHILIGTPASPLRKVLIDSGLGEDLAGGGVDDELRQMFFSTGLKGIAVENADKVEVLILQTLTSLAHNRIDPDTIEASVNTIEFALRENNTGSYPRGLILMLRSLTTWLYNGDPLAPLAFEAPLQALKDRLASGEQYFENLISHYLVKNTHRTTILLKPDPEVRQRQEAAEQERLAQARAAMSAEELQAVIDHSRELKRLQATPDSPEALATIPSLTRDDLEKQNKLIPLDILKADENPILYHDLFTNGIVYLDLGFNLHTLPQELLPYIPLFGHALVKIGTETEDFVKISQRIGRKTGGIWPSRFTSAIKDAQQGVAWLFLHSKATVARTDDLLAILRDLLLTVKLDNPERFKQLVLEAKAHKETGLVPNGHSVVNMRLGAHFDESGWANEQMGGVSYLFFLRQLAEDVERNWPSVLAKLEEVRHILVNRNALLCNVTLDQDNWTQVQPKLTDLINALPAVPVKIMPWSPQQLPAFEGLTIPARVNYVAKGANLYELGYQFHSSVAVILNYIRTTWLWKRVRVQGGAYGGFCAFDRFSGVFSYLSYRDPNLLDTLENYDQTSQFLQDTDLSEDELTKSIIGVIGQMDAYQLPDAKGYTSMIRYLTGISEEERQRIRDEVLTTRPEDFKAFADTLRQVNDKGLVVVMGSQEAIGEANAARGGWLQTLKVL